MCEISNNYWNRNKLKLLLVTCMSTWYKCYSSLLKAVSLTMLLSVKNTHFPPVYNICGSAGKRDNYTYAITTYTSRFWTSHNICCLLSTWTGCEMCPPCFVMPFGRCSLWVASSGCSGFGFFSALWEQSPTWPRRSTSSLRHFSVCWDSWTISLWSYSSLCTSPSCTERW